LPAIDFRGARVAAPRTAAPAAAGCSGIHAAVVRSLPLPRHPAGADAPAEIDLTALAAAAETIAPRRRTTCRRSRSHGAAQRHARPHLPFGGHRQRDARRTAHGADVRKALDILRPGDTITLTHVDGVLQSLNAASATRLRCQSRAHGRLRRRLHREPARSRSDRRARAHRDLAVRRGRAAGMSAQTVMVLANEIFGWDIDFANDIRRATSSACCTSASSRTAPT